MSDDSIKNRVIWRLTNGRKLADGEIRELDALQVALDLDDNDPTWAHIGWAWAMLPRRSDFDVAVQSISDRVAGITVDVDLTEVHRKLDDLTSRPTPEIPVAAAPVQIDEAMLKRVMVGVVSTGGGGGGQIDFIRQFQAAVIETVSWVWVVVAGLLLAGAILLGYAVGTRLQERDDVAQVRSLQGQVSTLTAIVSGKGGDSRSRR